MRTPKRGSITVHLSPWQQGSVASGDEVRPSGRQFKYFSMPVMDPPQQSEDSRLGEHEKSIITRPLVLGFSLVQGAKHAVWIEMLPASG